MRKIKLTQDKVTLVDDDLYEHLSQWKWRARKRRNTYYVVRDSRQCESKVPGPRRKVGRTHVYMHRVVAELRGMSLSHHIDHEDGNGLNNQSYNLRASTNEQNQANHRRNKTNTSGFRGVSWLHGKGWRAEITVDQQHKFLGLFDTAFEGALAYAAAARMYFGGFAYSNERHMAGLEGLL